MGNKTRCITESYMSPRVLPKEQILSWVKWDPSIEFDKIVIKSEPDLAFERILNVDIKVFEQTKSIENGLVELEDGILEIDKKIIQVPGFIGFRALYNLVPEDERKLSFLVEFLHDDKIIDSVEMITDVVRPKLIIVEEPAQGIIVDQYSPIPPLSFTLQNKGKGMVQELNPFLDVKSWEMKSMKIQVKETKEQNTDETPVFVLTNLRYTSKIIIQGKGMGMMSMGFEYYDKMHNKYATELARIPLKIPQKETLEVPVTSNIEGKQMLLLEPKVL